MSSPTPTSSSSPADPASSAAPAAPGAPASSTASAPATPGAPLPSAPPAASPASSAPPAASDPPASSAPPPSSVHPSASKVKRAYGWVLGGYVGSQLLRLGQNLILWRILYPEAFGLMAIVNSFMQGLYMFSDLGIKPSIVQDKRGDVPEFLNTAWTLQVLRSVVLAALSVAAAIPMARFYGEPELAGLIAVVGLSSILTGFHSTRIVTAYRHIALGRITLLDLGTQFAAFVATLIVALITKSVWALVVGNVVASAIKLVLSFTAFPGIKNRFAWHHESLKSLVRFGRWIFASTLLTFLVLQSDRLIFGKLVPLEVLGVYSIASMWAGVPALALGHVFASVVFPVLSRVKQSNGNFGQAVVETRLPWLLLAGWCCALLFGGGSALVRILYDQRAAAAEWIISLLALSTWFQSLEASNSKVLLAQGHSREVAFGNAAKLIAMVVLIPTGYALSGFSGALLGYVASEPCRYAVSALAVRAVGFSQLRQDAWLTALLAVTSLIAYAVARLARAPLDSLDWPFRITALLEALLLVLLLTPCWGLVFLRIRKRSASVT